MAYNGWTNKETWLVNLWLGNVFAEDQEYGEEITPDYIKSFVDEMASEALESGANGFITDLLNCALGEINHQEIADHYRESV
jgi:hypothetical protein